MEGRTKLHSYLLLVGSLVIIWVSCSDGNSIQNNEQVLARINDLTVSENHFLNTFREYYYRTGQVLEADPVTRNAILDTEFNTYVMAVKAMDDGLEDQEYVQFQKEAIKRRVLTEEYLNQVILEDVEVTDEDLQDYFVRFNSLLRASHLYARTKSEAEALYTRLEQGESFEELAREVFQNEYMAENGGDIGRFTTDELDIAFENAAFSLKKGEYSKPVRTAQGYSIVKLTERVTKPILTEYEFFNQKAKLETYVYKKKKELKTRAHLEAFTQGVILDEKLVTEIWEDVVNRFELFADKEAEFIQNLPTGTKKLATFGDFEFSMNDFTEEYLASPAPLFDGISGEESFRNFVIGLAYRKLLIDGAYENELDEQQAVQESINETYYQFLADEAEQLLRESITNTEAELYNAYQQNEQQYEEPMQINLQRLVVKTEDEADKLLKALNNGADFTELVMEYTIQNEDLFTSGELGFLSIKTFGFSSKQLSKLEVGEVSGVIPYTAEEFHIYKCLGKIDARSLSFNEARERVDNYLTNKKFRELRAKTIEQVKAKHNAKIDIEKLNELTIQI